MYQKVAQLMLESLEKGHAPWERPWRVDPHHNPLTGTVYRGMNQLLLENHANSHFQPFGVWLTFQRPFGRFRGQHTEWEILLSFL
ncbi:MAG: DUF1738 domain-containing protein [Gammaproteobacteria bacterium]|nr:MAG: DUF1738 domain-containing protein [Gammaproteobacteria bacterium]